MKGDEKRVIVPTGVKLANKDAVEGDEAEGKAVEPEGVAKAGLEPVGPERANVQGGTFAPGEVIIHNKARHDPYETPQRAQ